MRSVLLPLGRFLFGDLWWKLFSLAVAVLLWILVAGEPELFTFVRAPVQYRALPEGLEVSSPIVETVYLELRGPSGRLGTSWDDGRHVVVLDMSGVQPGQRTFTIGPGEVRLPRGIRLVQAIPSQLRFEFEPRAYATVPVEVRFSPPPPGYEVASFTVTPAELQIVGPRSRVRDTPSVATDSLDLSVVVGPQEFRTDVFAEDARVRFLSPPRVAVAVQVKARPDVSRQTGRRENAR